MNPSQSGKADDNHRHRAAELNLTAARLDVYKYERLGYTEIPVTNSSPRPPGRMAKLLKAIGRRFISRS